jgi:hypothetical protein
VLSFSGPALENGSLPDGHYVLSIDGSQILDSFGQQLDAAGTGTAGSLSTVAFFRFFGDSNGDSVVNGLDIALVSANWLGSGPSGDVNGDGVVNGLDIAGIASNWLAGGAAGGSAAGNPASARTAVAIAAAQPTISAARSRADQPIETAAVDAVMSQHAASRISNLGAPALPAATRRWKNDAGLVSVGGNTENRSAMASEYWSAVGQGS